MCSNYEKLSYCGIFCGNCRNYKKNMNCSGCRNEKEMISDYPTRACAIEKELAHCGECAEFPCEMLNKFYNDGSQLHQLAYQNMKEIIERGVDVWLEGQKDIAP